MKTCYIECKMGAAGDMLMSGLYELLDEKKAFIDKMNNLGLSGVSISESGVSRCGIDGTHINVYVDGVEEESYDVHQHEHQHEHEHHHEHEHEHHHEHGHHHEHSHHHYGVHTHTSMADIESIIEALDVSDKVKKDAIAVYKLVALAESASHGKPVSEIHFHEVGMKDAICDIVGVCLLMEMLAFDKIIVSPIHVGSGQVRCAHGILPVPAPATAHILKGVPIYSGDIEGELCTPTGAALLKYFADEFGKMPIMSVEKNGYGMGRKEFEAANCVRIFAGEQIEFTDNKPINNLDTDELRDVITELVCNLDDSTPEQIGFAIEKLLDAGALDVFTTSIGMKKNRPGVMLTVLCAENIKGIIIKDIFKYTNTLGIRESICNRYILNRSEKTVHTEYGDVRVKESFGYGVRRQKPEYEDLARIARENNISIDSIKIEDK